MLDQYWQEVLEQIKTIDQGSPVVAPAEFQSYGLNVVSHYPTVEEGKKSDFFIVHKGECINHDGGFLKYLKKDCFLIFANEVFVVFGNNSRHQSSDDKTLLHGQCFFKALNSIDENGSLDNQRFWERQAIKKRRDRQCVYLGGYRVLTKTIYGRTMVVDSRDMILAPHIIMEGVWEEWITKAFLRLIRPGMHVVDIGSNVGYYSIIAGEEVGQQGKLTAFEANPEFHGLTFHNLVLNGLNTRSEVINKAVYSSSCILDFQSLGTYKGASGLWVSPETVKGTCDEVTVIPVQTISLDEHFPEGTKIDLIRMDIEGAEIHALRGARRILKENPDLVIMMEFNPGYIEQHSGSYEAIYEEISSYGFDIYRINADSSLSLLPLAHAYSVGHIDVVLKKKSG